jgi:hypothetical protein
VNENQHPMQCAVRIACDTPGAGAASSDEPGRRQAAAGRAAPQAAEAPPPPPRLCIYCASYRPYR